MRKTKEIKAKKILAAVLTLMITVAFTLPQTEEVSAATKAPTRVKTVKVKLVLLKQIYRLLQQIPLVLPRLALVVAPRHIVIIIMQVI